MKNLCHFEMGGGGRSMLTVADRGEGGDKICQNLADVICERSLRTIPNKNTPNMKRLAITFHCPSSSISRPRDYTEKA